MAIEFQLFAPRNENAQLIGSFSDWQPIDLQKDSDGYFRTHVDLEDGTYQYKFRIQSNSPNLEGKWIDINDPYMSEMNLATETGILHVKSGDRVLDDYAWKHDRAPLPTNEELILYELHITDFCGADVKLDRPNKLDLAIEKLDYLQALGINAIALMPLTEYAGNYRWGYMVRYYFALESSYGKPQDFKRFVDECHQRGIRVLIDGIYNHTDDKSPLLQIDRDYWYYHDRHYPDDDANYWGPEFNYDNFDETRQRRPAWEFIRDVVQFWIREYHIDGIRYDAVRQIANPKFFNWLIDQAQAAVTNKPFLHIAEHIPDTSEICKPNGAFDSCWHESFRYFLKDAIVGNSFDLEELKTAIAAQPQGYSTFTNVINYLATHDREHFIVELKDAHITDVMPRLQLSAILQMTAPGLPMLWMGDEFGQDTHKTKQTSDRNPLKWELLDQQPNQDLLTFYQQLIALRREKDALRSNKINFFHTNADANILAYVRWNDAGEQVITIANFSDQRFDRYELPNFPDAQRWSIWNSDRTLEVKDGTAVLAIEPFSAQILFIQ